MAFETNTQETSEYYRAIDDLRISFPGEVTSICEAIHRNDEQEVREQSKTLGKQWFPLAKSEAIRKGHAGLLRILLEADESVNEALMGSACETKDRESIRALFDFNCPVNARLSPDGFPLWSAVDDFSFMQWLIKHGADTSVRSNLDQSTLSKAIVVGSMEVVDFLLAKEDDVTRGDLLHCAAERTDQNEGAALALELLQRGADVNAHRYNNTVALRQRYLSKLETPLHTACFHKNAAVAKILLDHGANLHSHMLQQFKEVGPTPFEVARTSSSTELADLLMAEDLRRARM